MTEHNSAHDSAHDPAAVVTETDSQVPSLRLGISACVLGQEVRFDGGHKLDKYIRDTLGSFVEFVPVCPEVEVGLGMPRETLRLKRRAEDARPALVAPKSQSDHSEAMLRYARDKSRALSAMDLCGFIVKKNSPSCGMERVKVYPETGTGSPSRDGVGAFTRELMAALPLLPIEEDGRLRDPVLRENFIERVFAYHRLRSFFAQPWRASDLMRFHAREKLLLMAHSDYRPLGKLVAESHSIPKAQLQEAYSTLFLQGLAKQSNVGKHSNVLQHIAGYFRDRLDVHSRREVHEQIAGYQARLLPLVAPLTLMRHHIRSLELNYLQEQSYLWPHPPQLMLRNHA